MTFQSGRMFPALVATLVVFLLAVPEQARAGIDIVLPGIRGAVAVTPAEKLFQTGIAALQANDLAKAEESFNASLKLDAGAAAPFMGLAQVALRRGQKSVAEGHMKKALALAPDTASIQTTWGTYLYSQRELPEAEAALRKATALDPRAVIARVQLGDLYLVGFNKADEAVKEYRAAIAVAPAHAGAHYALGLALATTNDLAGAETALTQASKLAPTNPLPLHVLGRVYAGQGNYDKALASYAGALKALPTFAAPRLERGHVFAAKGDDSSALKEYAAAQKLAPKQSAGYLNVGVVHQRHSRWTEAEQAYLAAVKIEPRNAVAYNNLAWMAADRKVNLTKALEWAQKAVALGPKVAEFQGTLGWVYRAQGNLDKAEQTLRAAAATRPSRPAVVFTLARVYLERGKKAQGASEIKRALALDPNFPGADLARSQLKALGQN